MIAGNAGRYPISAQCEILGVPRSTYYAMRARAEAEAAPDPATACVVDAYERGRGRYGARKIKAALERRGITLSRRRIGRIMKENGLVSAYTKAAFRPHSAKVNEADVPNVIDRRFD